jgi:hypothetical protein
VNAPTTTRPAARTIDVTKTSRVPFSRLVTTEWRKMLDTRAGFWLLTITGLMLVLAFAITLLVIALVEDASVTAAGFAEIMVIPVSLLVPIFAVLITTSEWGQRTHLVTFAGEPNRLRVIGAKLVTVALLALATIAVAVVLGAVGNVLAAALGGYDATWNFPASIFGWYVAVQVLYFLMGFGLGMLILNTPGAVSVFYLFGLLVPFMIYQPLMFVFEWARDVLPWIDLNLAFMPFITDIASLSPEEAEMLNVSLSGVGGVDYAQAVVATLLWVALPLILGIRRILRSEVK